MDVLRRLFGAKHGEPPLPPLDDLTLGRLIWDEDVEGWVGDIRVDSRVARLYVGAGSPQEYPSEALLNLLRQPYKNFERLAADALAYLRANMDFTTWGADPEELELSGLETYEHFLADRTYRVTFSHPDEAIWNVSFRDEKPIGCGVDD